MGHISYDIWVQDSGGGYEDFGDGQICRQNLKLPGQA